LKLVNQMKLKCVDQKILTLKLTFVWNSIFTDDLTHDLKTSVLLQWPKKGCQIDNQSI